MNQVNKFLTAKFLSAAMVFSSAAQAMEIRQFDKMADARSETVVSALDLAFGPYFSTALRAQG